MRTRYRISIGGVQMDSLDDNLCILNINYAPPERETKRHTTANQDGYEYGETKILRRTVTVTFELHEYGIKERNALCQKVNEWAAVGGTLITNDREGQRLLNVRCEKYADVSARDWTEPLTLVFSTTVNPYWRSNTQITRTLTGKNVTGTMNLDGNTSSSNVSVEVTASAAVTSLQLTVGDRVLKLTGLSISTGQKVVVDYAKDRYLRIKVGSTSLMGKLDPSSSDTLLAECGKSNGIGVVADGKVTAVFTARGCWM